MEEIDGYIIHDDLASLHRVLSTLEYQQLEANCIEDGEILDPIIIWEKYVLDGRHRLRIAKEQELPYTTKQLELEDFESAKRWVVNSQLGKRNLSDYEMTRLRAEQAKLEGTQAVAEAHGVSRRTVQRDLELDGAREMMSDDIREKVEQGTIIAPKNSLKKYGALTDDQRLAVDEALRRNPGLTLTQAIPSDDVKLKPADFAAINANPHLTARHKQSISLGTIHATSDSVKAFMALKPEDQLTVAELLDDRDIDDLGDAIRIYNTGRSLLPVDDAKKVEKLSEKIRKYLEDLLRMFDDLKAIKNDKSGHRPCVNAVKDVMESFDSWR